MTIAKSATRSQAFPDPIPGIISHGSLNLLAGASGVGKTCLMAWVLKRLRDGLPIFDRATNAPTKLGYVCADRGHTTARYWLDKAEYPDIAFYSLADDDAFNTSRLRSKVTLIKILGECFDKLSLPPGALVVVDPLAIFMGGNLNDYMNCAVACLEMRRECKRRQLTLIGTAHASKQKSDRKERYQRLQDRILGSSAQLGYGDTQLYLASPEETNERFYTFLWHSHTAPAEVFPLGRNKEGLFVPWAQSEQSEGETKVLNACTTDQDGTAFADVLIITEMPRATVFRILKEMVDDGHLLKVGHGRYRKPAPN